MNNYREPYTRDTDKLVAKVCDIMYVKLFCCGKGAFSFFPFPLFRPLLLSRGLFESGLQRYLLLALGDVDRSMASSPWKYTADTFLEFLEYNAQ